MGAFFPAKIRASIDHFENYYQKRVISFWYFGGQGIQILWLEGSQLGHFSSCLKKLAEFSVLTNI